MGKLYVIQWNYCGDWDNDIEEKWFSLREARKKVIKLEEEAWEDYEKKIHWQIVEVVAIRSCN